MPKKLHTHLSRRETQIMDVMYRRGTSATCWTTALSVSAPAWETDRTPARPDVRRLLHDAAQVFVKVSYLLRF